MPMNIRDPNNNNQTKKDYLRVKTKEEAKLTEMSILNAIEA